MVIAGHPGHHRKPLGTNTGPGHVKSLTPR